MVGHGVRVPHGHLPVFSVDTPEEAQRLIGMTCNMSHTERGVYIAPELAETQNLANLAKFSDRLAWAHSVLVSNGRCTCTAPTPGEDAHG